MKTDVILISSEGEGTKEALDLAEKAALYRGIAPKSALHLRLLTEELLGMMRSITKTCEGRFWIESIGANFQLHLQTETFVSFDKREQLLQASSSGKNEAAKGIMGKIRTFFDPLDGMPTYFSLNADGVADAQMWSMRAYEQNIAIMMENDMAEAQEAWDELEKSIVSHVADEVKVSIRGREVEMVIYKKMVLE